jgi:hypothetical protein
MKNIFNITLPLYYYILTDKVNYNYLSFLVYYRKNEKSKQTQIILFLKCY